MQIMYNVNDSNADPIGTLLALTAFACAAIPRASTQPYVALASPRAEQAPPPTAPSPPEIRMPARRLCLTTQIPAPAAIHLIGRSWAILGSLIALHHPQYGSLPLTARPSPLPVSVTAMRVRLCAQYEAR